MAKLSPDPLAMRWKLDGAYPRPTGRSLTMSPIFLVDLP